MRTSRRVPRPGRAGAASGSVYIDSLATARSAAALEGAKCKILYVTTYLYLLLVSVSLPVYVRGPRAAEAGPEGA